MKHAREATLSLLLAVVLSGCQTARTPDPMQTETQPQRDARMEWWRAARFGMFIHWGLYAIPAGEWNGATRHAEWIRHTARIPIDEYDQFVGQFDPVRFDAEAWARMARAAGMKYIVITSKHHDGFCLFDSAHTDFDVMSTPFKRDILAELSAACRRHGLKMCWYHSIMDWHHPDYLPRRDWEQATRPAGDADYDRYVTYMKGQLRELLTHYGPIGVLWFDGEWEYTWTHERGVDLAAYVRGLQPDIIINNRVDKGRAGMAGLTSAARFAGDFGTPEQEIPATGFPGVDWESCITMNDHWGYNRSDHNWKSTAQLIRMLVDIASKGGNLLLNVGPKADGTFPTESIDRLREIGAWMDVNGASIHGTQASPFSALPWGRCTQESLAGGDTRLYLHVFDWPADQTLRLPGICNEARAAYLLADSRQQPLAVTRGECTLAIQLPVTPPDPIDTVVVLDLIGRADVTDPPAITAEAPIFIDTLDVHVTSDRENVALHVTTDGSVPTAASPLVRGPVRLTQTATVRARAFRDGTPVSDVAEATFERVAARPATPVDAPQPGLAYAYYEGEWDQLPAFDRISPVKTGVVMDFDFAPRRRLERFGFRYRGFVTVPRAGVYTFYVLSDDGSQLHIGDALVVDNDGLHSAREATGTVALAAGAHPITVTFFEKTGDDMLEVGYAGPGITTQRVPPEVLMHEQRLPPSWLTPSRRQLAWQALETHAFIHFGMNTFTNREWGDGTEDPALFNPTAFDARQWVAVLRDAGMKQIVLTAKHHDGFCLWPSQYTTHSVASSPWRGGRGDVVREVADAGRAAGLKFGIYLSPWDRHEPSYGDSPRYNEYYKSQLRELLTNYGPIHEVWFDGACGEGPNGKRQEYDWPGYIAIIRDLQPDAVIFSDAGPDVRWVGNEQGYAGETNWSMLRRDEFHPGTPEYRQLTAGHEDGTHWVPAECDVSIRPGWYYHAAEDDQVKSLAALLDIYYRSVGRNAVLLLNVPPDPRGLIHEADAARLRELRAVLDETFATNLAAGRDVDLVDGAYVLDLGAPVTFDRVLLQEDIAQGQRVRAFALEAWDGAAWQTIADGTTIGYKRLLRIEPCTATHVRLHIRDARATPVLQAFELYQASPRETAAEAGR
jgi:alpha-L-fucosidase